MQRVQNLHPPELDLFTILCLFSLLIEPYKQYYITNKIHQIAAIVDLGHI